MNMSQEVIETLQKHLTPEVLKGFIQPTTATTGLQEYSLENPAKRLFPVLTPLRNSIPRVTGGTSIQSNWKAITNINVNNVRAGLGEGLRGGIIQHELKEYNAAFRGFGLDNNATFESTFAGVGYEDIKALAVEQLLKAVMVQEERLILGGNTSVSLGTTATPTLTASSGGKLPAETYSVICVALGMQAYLDVVGVNNGGVGSFFNAATAQIQGQITRNNADGSTSTFGDGSAQKSAAASVVVTANQKITAKTTPLLGAIGYAWYLGAAGSERLVAVSSTNSVILTSVADANAQLASSIANSDHSTSSLDFDGLFYQAVKPGSNAYIKTMLDDTTGLGKPLTVDGAGGVEEFEDAFRYFYDRYRLSPTQIYVSSQELVNLSKKIIGNNGNTLLRVFVDKQDPTRITAGTVVGQYLNKVTGTTIPITVHPNLPAGTVLMITENLPYALSNISNVMQMKMRRDYYNIEWPIKSRSYEYGVYADGVLQHYAPFSMGVITNILNA
jgi:hypothetical protein